MPMGVSFAPNGQLLVVDTVRLRETWWSFRRVESSESYELFLAFAKVKSVMCRECDIYISNSHSSSQLEEC